MTISGFSPSTFHLIVTASLDLVGTGNSVLAEDEPPSREHPSQQVHQNDAWRTHSTIHGIP